MKRVFIHIAFWIIIVIWTSFMVSPHEELMWSGILYNLLRLPLIMAGTYFCIYYLIPKFLINRRSYLMFGATFLIVFLSVSIMDRILIGYLSTTDSVFEPKRFDFHFFSQVAIMRNMFILFSIIGFASLIRFFKLYSAQKAAKMRAQKEHLNTELAFLRSQINPHFLFNITNNLYSVAVENNQQEIASGLEHLSDIMRYLTYDSNSPKVPLAKEVKLIQNYIELQNLRIGEEDDVTISFRTEGDLNNRTIAPVILLPLVENAFKHGIKLNNKSIIDILIKVSEKTLQFTVSNTDLSSSESEKKQKNLGIGLMNVSKRLGLLYPKSHTFVTTKEKGIFRVYLEIEKEN